MAAACATELWALCSEGCPANPQALVLHMRLRRWPEGPS